MNKTIVLADDDAMFRAVMRRALNALGFGVVEHVSGRGVVEQVTEIAPAACIVDICMDDKEGIETITDIVALAGRPKIVAVSSNALYLELVAGLGADACLVKPVAPARLEQTLRDLGVLA